ncbi:NIPSNAP family protein [Belliella sp. DSM 107340]|uniref:NIPSNAP family protein n=1 Tax=Belliella calami TaxID=2923436 RepID=A0ABS9URP5_9BACT|nr:NIPSNAP family protein [Belliella calami]MCH7399303.1 NIPSNAP family protein [Belliella calami]
MNILKSLLILFLVSFSILASAQDSRYFEMRTYTAHEGKRSDLISRFENHTLQLFEKNGIENIAYFIPLDPTDYKLTFIIAYPDKDSREKLWEKFANDPEWTKVKNSSESNGPLVSNIEQTFMVNANDLSPEMSKLSSKKKIFELRKYDLEPGKVDAINARFRDYTREIFPRYGMTNVMYWYTVEEEGVQPKLVYLLAHKNEKMANFGNAKFEEDADWKKIKAASEMNGPIVKKVEMKYLKALSFSPMK